MNICFLCQDISSHGGTEKIVSELAGELTNEGYSCYIVSIYKTNKGYFDFSCIKKIEYLDNNGGKVLLLLKRIKQIRKFIQENNIDILITVGLNLSIYGWGCKKRIKWISWEHEMFDFNKTLFIKTSRLISVKKADVIIVLTRYDKKRYEEVWSRRIKKIRVIPNFTREYDMSEKDKKNIIAVGRLWTVKQFDYLVKAWSNICDRLPDWKLIIYGEGQERENLERLIEKKNIKNVYLPGFTEKIQEAYENAGIYAITSQAEGFSMVLLEAMSSSLPIVGFFSHGGVENLVNEENGILLEQGDIQGLSSAILKLADDAELRRKMGKNSYQKALNFSAEKILCLWKKVL